MSLSPADVNRYGDELYSALVDMRTVPNFRDRAHGIDVTDAYRIQSRMVQRRIDAGETIVGKKVGATSAAVMTLLGLDEPDFGQLLSGMVYSDGDTIKLDSLIQPRAEGEIAFVLKHDLAGPGSPQSMCCERPTMSCRVSRSSIHGSTIGTSRLSTRSPTTRRAVSTCWASITRIRSRSTWR